MGGREPKSMGGREPRMKVRPWTVYALVALSAGGLIWGLIGVSDRNVWDVPLYLLGLGIAYSLWAGKRWAFTVSFMLTTLCAGFIAVIALIQVFLLDRGAQVALLWGLLVSSVWIALLMHPATKRFAGLDEPSRREIAAG